MKTERLDKVRDSLKLNGKAISKEGLYQIIRRLNTVERGKGIKIIKKEAGKPKRERSYLKKSDANRIRREFDRVHWRQVEEKA